MPQTQCNLLKNKAPAQAPYYPAYYIVYIKHKIQYIVCYFSQTAVQNSHRNCTEKWQRKVDNVKVQRTKQILCIHYSDHLILLHCTNV